MFIVNAVKTLPFKIKFEDGKILNLNRPKMKAYKMAMCLSLNESQNEDVFDELAETVAYILSNNKEKKKINAEFVYEHFDILEIIKFVKEFLEWANQMANNPN